MSWKITSTFSIFLDIFLSVLTDQPSQVQATNKVLIHVMCVGLSKKNRISNISRIFKKNPHSNAKRCIQILGVRQAVISGARDAMM